MLSGSFLIVLDDGAEYVLTFDIASGDSTMSELHRRGVADPVARPSGCDCYDVLACACQFLTKQETPGALAPRVRRIDAKNYDEGYFDAASVDVYAGVSLAKATTVPPPAPGE